jgi:hypothetical protein
MRIAMSEQVGIPGQRGFWLRCFLGRACVAMAVWLLATGLCWARVAAPGPIHLWRLHGFYMNAAGKPIENAEVSLLRDEKVVYTTRTDGSGRFSFDHVAGRFWLHIKAPNYSQLLREVVVGLETATVLRRNTLYVIAGPGACSDDCSSIYTSKNEFDRTVRRNTEHQYQD